MGKGRYVGVLVLSACIVSALGSGSCGTANDQGIAFRAIGFVTFDPDKEVAELPGELGQAIPLGCPPTLIKSAIKLENNMIQGINVDRVDLFYDIPGGSFQLAPGASPFSARLGPSSNQEPNNPPLNAGELSLVSPSQVQQLNQNRGRLPELPFRMNIRAQAAGVADSGDFFRTNRVNYFIEFLGDEHCESTEEPEAEPTPE